jgi:hypothetical protein
LVLVAMVLQITHVVVMPQVVLEVVEHLLTKITLLLLPEILIQFMSLLLGQVQVLLHISVLQRKLPLIVVVMGEPQEVRQALVEL